LQTRFGDELVIIGICHPKGSEKMREVVDTKGIDYPVAVDREGAMIQAYEVNSFPDYYVIDQSGRLVVADCQNSKVEEVVAGLLGP
jgi:cytochrome c biogenesis protein CcmG/thiol:disulfide interchange protein DsbE